MFDPEERQSDETVFLGKGLEYPRAKIAPISIVIRIGCRVPDTHSRANWTSDPNDRAIIKLGSRYSGSNGWIDWRGVFILLQV